MLLSVWLAIGVIATLSTGLALLTTDDGVAIVTGVLGFLGWTLWSYGALDIQRPVEGATSLTFSEPFVTLFGIGIALIPAFIALNGPVEIIARYRDATVEDI